jgi:DNA ligase D
VGGIAMGSSTKERTELKIGNEKVAITSPSKPLWPDKGLKKLHYLQYLNQIAPHLLPFLNDRLLTTIRYPHGADGESFYQKNCPNYAPDFVQRHPTDDINYIVCSDLPTLIWLGNQLAFEFHIPFQTIHSKGPSEIVFDLDPPSRKEFHLAVEAALMIKEVFDKLKLISFVKTSGNKGLQLYLPLPENTFSYEDTRRFTYFIAQYLTTKEPNWFTIERLKAKRGNKLYVDYIQHAEGKTIIAPYSVRGNKEALVATPLFWKEVHQDLRPEHFPLEQTIERIQKVGSPFTNFFKDKDKQNFKPVLDWLTAQGM